MNPVGVKLDEGRKTDALTAALTSDTTAAKQAPPQPQRDGGHGFGCLDAWLVREKAIGVAGVKRSTTTSDETADAFSKEQRREVLAVELTTLLLVIKPCL